jgi:hypothetical protein
MVPQSSSRHEFPWVALVLASLAGLPALVVASFFAMLAADHLSPPGDIVYDREVVAA